MIGAPFTSIEAADALLVHVTDTRSWPQWLGDICLSIFSELQSRWQRQYNPLKGNIFPCLKETASGFSYEPDRALWRKDNSHSLAVFIHGLNSSPLAWTNYLVELSKRPGMSCFAPCVYKKGYCALDRAAKPILKEIQCYVKAHPHSPVFLLGHSNGARIAAYIEQKLPAGRVHLISIAGPHGGSQLINWMNTLSAASWFGIAAPLSQELAYQGPWAIQYLRDWQTNQGAYHLTGKKVERLFFATREDLRIFPSATCFPRLASSSYILVDRASHVTILDKVHTQLIAYIDEKIS